MREATVGIPLTCGELVQGLWEGTPALVSCPIDRYHRAHVRLDDRGFWELPDEAPKAATALETGIARLRGQVGGVLKLDSPAPRGRGYGTSTADIAASLYALGEALRQPFTPADIAQIAVGVEPSDSTIFPELTLFTHRDGTNHQVWGTAPPLSVILLDPGGEVDTLAFNQRDIGAALSRLESIHKEAFSLLQIGLRERDWEAVGKAASLSAIAHQGILFSPLLETAVRLCNQIDALGVCRAHSGTILGLILDPSQIDIFSATTYIQENVHPAVSVCHHHIVGGGPRYAIKRPDHLYQENYSIKESSCYKNYSHKSSL
jgi:L-threonine kinase